MPAESDPDTARFRGVGNRIYLATSYCRNAHIGTLLNEHQEDLIEIEIAASVLAKLHVELDRTTAQFDLERQRTSNVQELVRRGVPLMCKDVIPAGGFRRGRDIPWGI